MTTTTNQLTEINARVEALQKVMAKNRFERNKCVNVITSLQKRIKNEADYIPVLDKIWTKNFEEYSDLMKQVRKLSKKNKL